MEPSEESFRINHQNQSLSINDHNIDDKPQIFMETKCISSSEDESDSDENVKKVDFSQQYRYICHLTTKYIPPNFDDPGLWPEPLTDYVREQIVEDKLQKINDDDKLAKSIDGFDYAAMWTNVVPSQIPARKHWLLFSKSQAVAFCFCCKLFGDKNADAIVHRSIIEWHCINRKIKLHEESPSHEENMEKWTNLKPFAEEQIHWQCVIKKYINLMETVFEPIALFPNIYYYDSLDANSLAAVASDLNSTALIARDRKRLKISQSFISYMSLVNILCNHVKRLQDVESHYYEADENLETEICEMVTRAMEQEITKQIQEEGYFSIILNDISSDFNGLRCAAIRIQFLKQSSQLKEYFIGCHTNSGASMANLKILEPDSFSIEQILQHFNLDIYMCRGISYDSVWTKYLSEHLNGIESRIFVQQCPYTSIASISMQSAVYITTFCHNGSSAFFFETFDHLFELLKTNWMWKLLKKKCTGKIKLKKSIKGQWSDNLSAIKTVLMNFDGIKNLLEKLTNPNASTILHKIYDFKFIFACVVWHDILEIIYQKLPINLTDLHATTSMYEMQTKLSNLKTDEMFEEYLRKTEKITDKLQLQNNLNIDDDYLYQLNGNYLMEQFSINRQIDTNINVKPIFQIMFYYHIIDTVQLVINDRINQFEEHLQIFAFLHNIPALINYQEPNSLYTQDMCMQLQNILNCDINGYELCNEIALLSIVIPSTAITPLSAYQFLIDNDLQESMPNIVAALKILLILPINVAGSVSKRMAKHRINLIEYILTQPIYEEQLIQLRLIFIEKELLLKMNFKQNYDESIRNLARRKAEISIEDV